MLLLVFAGLSCLAGAAAPREAPGSGYFDVAITPSASDRFTAAEYHLWVPEGKGALRGVIVRQHGCGNGATANGHTLAHDAQWQALARKHRCALLGTRMMPREQCQDWSDPANGSGEALVEALRRLGDKSGHPELASAPWVLWGHSGGGYWSASMAYRYPERTLAAVPARCRLPVRDGKAATVLTWMNGLPKGEPSAVVAAVPFLWAPGGKDPLVNEKDDPRDAFAHPDSAPWALAVAPEAGHETGDLRTLAIPYLDAVLSLRLPEKAGKALRPLAVSKGWRGNIRTGEIAPVSEYRGDPKTAAWLPDERTARRWKEYISTGTIAPPVSAPPPPVNVRAKRTAAGTELTWDATNEPGVPLPTFSIYRGTDRVGTLKPPSHGYGDEPRPVLWQARYVDSATGAASTGVVVPAYFVSASRESGAESSRIPVKTASAKRPAVDPPQPDLVVTRVEWFPQSPAPGDAVEIRATVRNRGTAPTPPGVPVSVGFRVDWQTLIGASSFAAPLAPGGEVTLKARTVPTEKVWTASAGKHTLYVEVDELARIPDGDRTNNIRSEELVVAPREQRAESL
jgi:poly(3-hydroxybutyrate) depolymerase